MAGIPVLMVTWFRYVVHIGLMSAIFFPRRGKALLKTSSLSRQLVRGMLMIATTVLFFTVLGKLPIAEATTLNFMAPLFVLALAPWLLGEPHRLHRWIGVVLGFAGVLIVVRPGSDLDPVGLALGLLTALVFAFFQISTRRVAQDDPITTNFYGGLFGTFALTLVLPWVWETPDLLWWQWLLLLSTGITGFLGHWLQIMAYSRTQATLLAPFSYLQIIAAAALGWFVFAQLPSLLTALGALLICVAGLGVVLWERRLARLAAKGS